MEKLFSTILNMTISGAIVILWVLAARLALRRAPKVFSYCLWAAVLFRLLCPVAFTSSLSALQVVPNRTSAGVVSQMTYLPAPAEPAVQATRPVSEATEAPSVTPAPVEEPIDWNRAAAHLWAAGAAALGAYGMLSHLALKRKLRESAPVSQGVREADGIPTPFVLGLFRPTIYLPSALEPREREYILRHERFHIRHGDPLVRAAFFLAVCLHWFNPFVWLAFRLCCRDMELRCDEAVLKTLDAGTRCDYAQSLLSMATGRWNLCTPLAFGEGDTGERVKRALGWKRRAAWVLVPAAVLCAGVMALTLSNPGGTFGSPFGHSYRMDLIADHTREAVAPAGRLYTLTDDQVLYIRDNSITEQLGTFQKARFDESFPDDYQSAELRRKNRTVWKLNTDDWWLLKQQDGSLWMVHPEAVFSLKRVDLLGIVIREPGTENQVQPYWCDSDGKKWAALETVTWVEGPCEIEFLPQEPADHLDILEERHQGTAVTSTNIDLPADESGAFCLNVSPEDAERITYTVRVGREQYYFTLRFAQTPTAGASPGPGSCLAEYSEHGAYIALDLPLSWSFEYHPGQGLSFWPGSHDGERLEFFHYPQKFGVCGTGLETHPLTLAGWNATAGVYDGGEIWSYISFPGGKFAVTGADTVSWWGEFGDEAMEILDSARFGETASLETVRSYLASFRPGGQVVAGENDYMATVHREAGTMWLYEYRVSGEEVTVTNEWQGFYHPDAPITINSLHWDGQWIYYGVFGESEGTFHMLLENGRNLDLILEGRTGFCFVCDAPMEDFQLLNADHEMIATLASSEISRNPG